MFAFLFRILGPILAQRWRGGGVFDLWFEKEDHATQLRRVTYAAFMGLLVGWTTGPELGAATALVLFLTQLTGNGRVIGALGGWEKKELAEWVPLDWISHNVARRLYSFEKDELHYKRAWGLTWFTVWGAAVAGLLALANWGLQHYGFTTGFTKPAYLGLYALHGVAYYLPLKKFGGAGWGLAELSAGALHAVLFFLAAGGTFTLVQGCVGVPLAAL